MVRAGTVPLSCRSSRLSAFENARDNGEEKMVANPSPPVALAVRLLVVDDDVSLCDLVAKYLESEGFAVHAVHSGIEGEAAALEGSYELIVLDVMLPDKKGFEVLKEIRAHGRCPVLMLTARGDEFDRVLGLELGADDYLSKPFSPRELVARIGAILRRSGWRSEGGDALRPPVIRLGDLELDPSARAASRAGEVLRLTSAEYDILRLLVASPGQVLTREGLVEQVLDRKFSPFDRSIDLHISNLRKKLGPHPDGTERIRSIRGIGYLYAWPNSKTSGTGL
jgi:DNA-binding response OmpR family regulator